ncbi:MAG: zinc-binding dehydrogenase [Paracoccaceae bacterium]
MAEHMSGIVLTGHGGPECLQWRDDLPVPQPMAGEVLVRLGAAAVNNTDINTRLAWYSKGDGTADDASWAGVPISFPRVQGIDGCGKIAGPVVPLDLRTLYLKDLSFYGCTALNDGVFAALVAHIEAKRIKPLIAAEYSLRDIGAAQAAFAEKQHIGKIVLLHD